MPNRVIWAGVNVHKCKIKWYSDAHIGLVYVLCSNLFVELIPVITTEILSTNTITVVNIRQIRNFKHKTQHENLQILCRLCMYIVTDFRSWVWDVSNSEVPKQLLSPLMQADKLVRYWAKIDSVYVATVHTATAVGLCWLMVDRSQFLSRLNKSVE